MTPQWRQVTANMHVLDDRWQVLASYGGWDVYRDGVRVGPLHPTAVAAMQAAGELRDAEGAE